MLPPWEPNPEGSSVAAAVNHDDDPPQRPETDHSGDVHPTLLGDGGGARVITARSDVDASFDAPAVLAELRKARRKQRLADIDWIDAAYRAYLTGLIGIVATLFVSSAVGDERLTNPQLASVDDHGAAAVGLVMAALIALGLRSGSRGGPIAMEAAEVRHVLLAPVDRGAALRSAALRQLRFAAFIGVVVGAVGGDLASKRFHANAFAWASSGALCGVLATLTMIGVALSTSGNRVRRPVATLLALAVLAWAGADVMWQVWSPMRTFGLIALWPRTFDAIGLIAIAITIATLVVGMSSVGGLLLELAERRTGLVGQMRFAVTMQDLRTVIILRRQLAQDTPRDRPWLPTKRASRRFVVFRRGIRAVLRFPAGRLARLVVLAVLAGVALRAAWHGTSPLILAGALALYIAALDVVEPLAQQVDQVDLTDVLPVEQGDLLLRHLVVPTLVMLVLGAIGFGVVIALEGDSDAIAMAALLTVPAVLAALAGAVSSVVMGAPEPPSELGQLIPPEAAGMKIAIRTAWPLVMATAGSLPVVMASKALTDGKDAYAAATNTMSFVFMAIALTVAWVRYRIAMKQWWRRSMEESQQAARDRQRAKIGG